MWLVGGRVLTPAGELESLDVEITGDRIVSVSSGGANGSDLVDVTGMTVAPGFVDVQINGGWGHDFTADPASIVDVARQLPATGVTAFLPTIVTSDSERRSNAIGAISRLAVGEGDARPLGLHLEGPAISPVRAGAHDPSRIGMPSAAEVAGWNRSNGVAMVTLAPELSGADAVIAGLVAGGVVVAAGHTDCSAAEFAAGRRAGITMVTHLFNAMRPFSHRDPGPIGATLADPDVFAGLICDGIHIDPVAVAMAWQALGPSRTILVTDAMAALGLAAGSTRLGDVGVTVDETGVRTAAGVLAGSNLALDEAVRNLIRFVGCAPEQALATVTANPAKLLGLADRGRIEVGARADVVVLDHQLHVRSTLIGGVVAWKS